MVVSSFLLISDLMLATTNVCASKTNSLSPVMVAKFTGTSVSKNALTASSLGVCQVEKLRMQAEPET